MKKEPKGPANPPENKIKDCDEPKVKRSYYYDDAHGYEIYSEEGEEGEEKETESID